MEAVQDGSRGMRFCCRRRSSAGEDAIGGNGDCQCEFHPFCEVGPEGKKSPNWAVSSRDDWFLFVDLTGAASPCVQDSRGQCVANQGNEKPNFKLSFNQAAKINS